VLEAARAGDRMARSVLHEVGELLGDACSTAIKLLNPDRLIISGRLSMFAEFLQPRVETQIQRHVIPEMLSGFSLHFAPYEAHQEAWGAALLALERFWAAEVRELAGSSAKSATLPWRVPPEQGQP
jgi:N-acetylglucosamine repressor